MKLESTYLTQRLNAPYPNSDKNPFTFGGGYKNGGLSGDATSLLTQFLSFDYMGAAEYEFGALPQSLNRMAKSIKDYVACETTINKVPVYFLCHKDVVDQIPNRLQELSNKKIHVKCGSHFDVATGRSKYRKKEDCRALGWMELDNDFHFFTSKEMFEGVRQIFGIEYK